MTSPKSGVAKSDRVSFEHEGRAYVGKVMGVISALDSALVLCESGDAFWLPPDSLKPLPKAIQAGANLDRLRFRASDRVRFELNGGTASGIIGRLNPKRAVVILDDGREYSVPYSFLEPENPGSGNPRSGESASGENGAAASGPLGGNAEDRLEKIAVLARHLMEDHGLKQWEFRFDNGRTRAGCCNHTHRTIGLSLEYALRATEDHVHDTLLHEIAHALAGSNHHHDAHWRDIAERIGGSAKRCHDLRFTLPRYIVTCENHCWYATAERRRRNTVCAECYGSLQYTTFTEERWAEVNPDKADKA